MASRSLPTKSKEYELFDKDPLVIACIFAAPYLCGKSENTYKGTVSSNELKRSWKRKEIMSVVSWHHWWLGMMIGMRGSWCLWNSTFKTYARYLCVHITKHFQPDLQIVLPLEEWDNLPLHCCGTRLGSSMQPLGCIPCSESFLSGCQLHIYIWFPAFVPSELSLKIVSSPYPPSLVFLSLYSIGSFFFQFYSNIRLKKLADFL